MSVSHPVLYKHAEATKARRQMLPMGHTLRTFSGFVWGGGGILADVPGHPRDVRAPEQSSQELSPSRRTVVRSRVRQDNARLEVCVEVSTLEVSDLAA